MSLNLFWQQWPKCSFRYLGGGGGPAPAAVAPVPTPAPPVTSDAPSVVQAEHDVAVQNLLKKSVKQTIIAGDTAYNPMGANAANQPNPSAGFKRGM